MRLSSNGPSPGRTILQVLCAARFTSGGVTREPEAGEYIPLERSSSLASRAVAREIEEDAGLRVWGTVGDFCSGPGEEWGLTWVRGLTVRAAGFFLIGSLLGSSALVVWGGG